MTSPKFEPIIRTQADLAGAWRTLMGPWGFGRPSVWVMGVVDDRPFPRLTEIAEAEEPPGAEEMGGFVKLLRRLAEDLGERARFGFLRSRPGSGAVTDDDRRWAAALYAAAREAQVLCETVHLATHGDVRPLPLDELGNTERSA